ncbi:MAG: guanylate kinase [Flavobacteriales bacterium]|nr:guanylate kinase [Flavobacteriales bacterium]
MTTRTGKSIILSAPSGAGKTTITRHLLNAGLGLEFSVSATSRPARPQEVHGKDYLFITPDEFRLRIDAGEFVEWEEVYPGKYYGTLRSHLEHIWGRGHHAVFDVDVLGGRNLKQIFQGQALALFVRPPSLEVLAERLHARGTETPESLRQRINKASLELAHEPHFDHVLLNDDRVRVCAEAEAVVRKFLAR